MDLGAVELMIVEFPGNRFTGDIAPALGELVEKGTIRLLDVVFVAKGDDDDSIVAFELSSVHEDVRDAFGSMFSNGESLLHDDDIIDVGEALEPGTSVAMILFEHTWANTLRSALIEAGAGLIDSLRIAPEAIDRAQLELSRTA